MFTFKTLLRCAVILLAVLLVLGIAVINLTPFSSAPDNRSTNGSTNIATEVEAPTPEGRLALFVTSGAEMRRRLSALELEHVRSGKLLYPSLDEKSRLEMAILTERLLTSLDLSAVPEEMRDNVGIETALLLSEALRLKNVTADTPLVSHNSALWSVNNTHVQISMLDSDSQQKRYLFSPATIANAKLLYADAKVSAPAPQAMAFDAYEYYIKTPGQIVPPAWAGLVLSLPDFWQRLLWENTLWQWGALLLALSGLFAVPASVSWSVTQRSRFLWMAVSLAAYAYFAEEVVIDEVNISGEAQIACFYLFGAVTYISTAIGIILFIEWLADVFIWQFKVDPTNVDASIVRLGSRAVGLTIAGAIICIGANRAGIHVFGVIAGLGIGGLAFALAAQTTLENLLACIIMYFDRPARIGDKIEAGEVKGLIEQIGLRSTRVRGEDGQIFSITNSDLAKRVIVNHSLNRG